MRAQLNTTRFNISERCTWYVWPWRCDNYTLSKAHFVQNSEVAFSIVNVKIWYMFNLLWPKLFRLQIQITDQIQITYPDYESWLRNLDYGSGITDPGLRIWIGICLIVQPTKQFETKSYYWWITDIMFQINIIFFLRRFLCFKWIG